jgi:hypothetical protein
MKHIGELVYFLGGDISDFPRVLLLFLTVLSRARKERKPEPQSD